MKSDFYKHLGYITSQLLPVFQCEPLREVPHQNRFNLQERFVVQFLGKRTLKTAPGLCGGGEVGGVCGIRRSRLFPSQVSAAQPRPQQPPLSLHALLLYT